MDAINMFEELLSSLSFAQVSIEKTSRFVLKNLERFDSLLLIWKKHALKADEKKLVPLLYLANDVIQKLKPQDDICKDKFIGYLLENINIFKLENVIPIFLRVLKIWNDRKVINPECISKFNNELEQFSLEIKSSKFEDNEYDVSKLIGFLNIFNEMNNIIVAYKSSISKRALNHYTKELSRCKFNHDCDYINQLYREIKNERQKCVGPFQEIKEAIINCKLQTSHIASYRLYYNKSLSSVEKLLEEYSEYRNRIIQLRWRIEKINQKMSQKIEKQNSIPDPDSISDNNIIADMEVDTDNNLESANTSIYNSLNDTTNLVNSSQILNPYPTTYVALNQYDPYNNSFNQYNSYNSEPPPIPPSLYNFQHLPSNARQFEEENYTSPTVVDYHHGILESQVPIPFYQSDNTNNAPLDISFEQHNSANFPPIYNNFPFTPNQIPPPFSMQPPHPSQHYYEDQLFDNYGNPYNAFPF